MPTKQPDSDRVRDLKRKRREEHELATIPEHAMSAEAKAVAVESALRSFMAELAHVRQKYSCDAPRALPSQEISADMSASFLLAITERSASANLLTVDERSASADQCDKPTLPARSSPRTFLGVRDWSAERRVAAASSHRQDDPRTIRCS